MLILLFCQCLSMPVDGLPFGGSVQEATQFSEASEPRPYHEISREMRAVLRREATARDEAAHCAALVELARLYGDIMRDPRLADSDTLRSYRVKIRSRLLRAQKDIERTIARRSRNADPPLEDASQETAAVTASQLSLQILLLARSGGRDSLSTMGSGAYGWFGGGLRRDYGPDLVALIQRTISPKSWDVHGGPGTIYYYWPWYALVVRNSAEVHRQIGGLRDGL